MRDPVHVVHDESGRTTVVPRGTVNTLAKSGWRLLSAPAPIDTTEPDDPEPSYTPGPILEPEDEPVAYRDFPSS